MVEGWRGGGVEGWSIPGHGGVGGTGGRAATSHAREDHVDTTCVCVCVCM